MLRKFIKLDEHQNDNNVRQTKRDAPHKWGISLKCGSLTIISVSAASFLIQFLIYNGRQLDGL